MTSFVFKVTRAATQSFERGGRVAHRFSAFYRPRFFDFLDQGERGLSFTRLPFGLRPAAHQLSKFSNPFPSLSGGLP
jgi:hypothetical protein